MPFKPGNPGRPKGAINRRSAEFREVLERHNFCPVTAMIEVYQEARKVYDNYGVIYEAIWAAKTAQEGQMAAPPEDKAHTYLKIAGEMAKDITSYTFPKLKSIEQTPGTNPLTDMTPQQRLLAMKQAVAFLEADLKKGEDGSSAP